MTAPSPGFAYAQARLQSRFGDRVEPNVWLKLYNIYELSSYLQVAQQTPLRQWVLGISASHSSNDIELGLRQKYRQHVDEVACWLPAAWKKPLQWIKRLPDLPALQYLATGGKPFGWMNADSSIRDFTVDDTVLRIQAMRDAGCAQLIKAWQKGDPMLAGWLKQWKHMRPQANTFDQGLLSVQKLLLELSARQLRQPGVSLPVDYEALADRLRIMFRRYTFQPAAACAYLAIVALDIHRIRADLLQRVFFLESEDLEEGVPI
jgi:hypothetical protein